MTLIPCTSCNSPISEKAASCPKCGCRPKTPDSDRRTGFSTAAWGAGFLRAAFLRPLWLAWTGALGMAGAGFLFDIEMLLLSGVVALIVVPVMYLSWLGCNSSPDEVMATPVLATNEHSAPAKKGQSNWFWFFVFLVIVNAYRGQQGLPPWNPFIRQPQKVVAPVTGSGQLNRNRGVTTAKYWKATVYELTRDDSELESASTVEDSIKLMHGWKNDLAAMEAVPTGEVDLELVGMVRRHLKVQAAMLAKLHEWVEHMPAESRKMSFAEASALGMAVLSGEVELKDDRAKAILKELMPLVEQIARQADEVIEMRGRLKERYKGLVPITIGQTLVGEQVFPMWVDQLSRESGTL